MKAPAFLALALTAAGCAREPPKPAEPTVAVPAASVATTEAPAESATAPNATRPAELARAEWRDGARLSARGRYSKTPWQHMMGNVPGKQPEYFDLEDRHQTVIYVDAPIECADLVEVVGTVMEVSGPSKRRSSDPPSKAEATHRELHIDVTEQRCLP